MAAEIDNVGVDLKTGMFGLKLSGANALLVFLFIINLTSIGFTVYEHRHRQEEHDQLQCMIRLNLFFQTIPKGGGMDWGNVPVDLYLCIPRFVYERNGAR